MNWLLITLGAYFLNAVAMVIDKSILQRKVNNAFVYTFYVAALGGLLIILALPVAYFLSLKLVWPGWAQFYISLLAGGAFAIGLMLMYWTLRRGEASRVLPIIGGLTPVFVLLLAYEMIGEKLSSHQLLAFIIIVIGSFIISLEFKKHTWQLKKIFWPALISAIFFALSYVLTKDVYNHQPFISGFIWTRLGILIFALAPMLYPANFKALLHQPKHQGLQQAKYRFLFGQSCGGASAVLIQYAISIASVSLVQALQGTQYVFIFLIVLISTFYFPKFLQEQMSSKIILQKISAIVLIVLGVYLVI